MKVWGFCGKLERPEDIGWLQRNGETCTGVREIEEFEDVRRVWENLDCLARGRRIGRWIDRREGH